MPDNEVAVLQTVVAIAFSCIAISGALDVFRFIRGVDEERLYLNSIFIFSIIVMLFSLLVSAFPNLNSYISLIFSVLGAIFYLILLSQIILGAATIKYPVVSYPLYAVSILLLSGLALNFYIDSTKISVFVAASFLMILVIRMILFFKNLGLNRESP